MKNREMEILFQLLKNSKLSDREIAKRLSTSQSTVTRIRHKLEKEFIQSYTAIPDLPKLGIELIAFTFGKSSKPDNDVRKKFLNFVETQSSVVIFSGYGEGMGNNSFMVSFHKTFSDFTEFMMKLRIECSDCMENIESFIVPTDKVVGSFNISKAVEHLIRNEEK